jgi:ribulose-5-phosphate 4-epimerase/fuculose-1-phosphate aldolase
MSELDDLRTRVAQACRVLGKLDLAEAATGHISARIPGTDRVLIRARGPGELGVRYTSADQVVEVDLDGKLTEGAGQGLEAPIEVFIHTAVYRKRPDIQSVVHVHPPTVVLFTICDKPLLPLYGAFDPSGAQMALAGVPTYPRSILISNPKLGDDLVQAMGASKVCLMRGHGITAAGRSVEEAALEAITLNSLATMNYRAQLLGNPRPILDEDQEVFREMAKAGRGRAEGLSGGKPSGRAAALWRYYVALTDS